MQQSPQPQTTQPSPYAVQSPITSSQALGHILGVQTPTYGDDRIPNRIAEMAQGFSQNVKQNWSPYMPKAGTPTLGKLQYEEGIRQFNEQMKYNYAALAAQRAAAGRAASLAEQQQRAKSAIAQGYMAKVNQLMQTNHIGGLQFESGLGAEDAIRQAMPTALEGAAQYGLGPDFIANELLPTMYYMYGIDTGSGEPPMSAQDMWDETQAQIKLDAYRSGGISPTFEMGELNFAPVEEPQPGFAEKAWNVVSYPAKTAVRGVRGWFQD